MPRSERCRIRGNCLDVSPCFPWRKLLSPGEPCRWSTSLAPAERLAAHGRLIGAGASRRTGLSPSGDRWAGLGERSKPAVAMQWQGCAKSGHSAMAWRTALKREAASHGVCDVSVFRHTGNAVPPNSRLQAPSPIEAGARSGVQLTNGMVVRRKSNHHGEIDRYVPQTDRVRPVTEHNQGAAL